MSIDELMTRYRTESRERVPWDGDRAAMRDGLIDRLVLLLRKRRTERLNALGVALLDKAIIATITDLWDLGCERDVAAVFVVWRRQLEAA